MLFRELQAASYEDHGNDLNAFCGQNFEFFNAEAGTIYIVSTVL
jgi:hypothetical protein